MSSRRPDGDADDDRIDRPPTCLRARRRSLPPTCRRRTPQARPTPTRPRSSSTTISAARTPSISISPTPAPNTWEVDAYDASTAATGGGFPYSSGPLATATLTFNPTQRHAVRAARRSRFTVPGGQTMSLDLSNLTQLAAGFSVSAATANGNAPATSGRLDRARTGRCLSTTPTARRSPPTTFRSPMWRARTI